MLDEAEVELDDFEADGWAECITDAQSRHEASDWLARKVAEFEASGGTITHIPHGVSGADVSIHMDYITHRLMNQRKEVNDKRHEQKVRLEPIRLNLIADELAKGTRGIAGLAKGTGMSYPLVRELVIKYKIDVGATASVPNKSYNQKTPKEVERIREDIARAMDSPNPPKDAKALARQINVPYTTMLRLSERHGWEIKVRGRKGEKA